MKTSFETPLRHFSLVTLRRLIVPSVIFVSAQFLNAQDEKEESPPTGFVRIANTIAPGSGNVKVLIDGKDVYSPGYKFGAVTGGIGLSPGGHTVTFRRDGVTEGSTKVVVQKDQTTTLIPFAERVPATDNEPARFEIRILRLKQKETQDGLSASFVSVSGKAEILAELRDPAGNWEKIHVKRLMIGEGSIKFSRGYVPIRVNQKDMEPIPISDAGNYVVVLYDDPEGNLKSVSFRDFKFLSAE